MNAPVTKMTVRVLPDGDTMTVKGRAAWALKSLILAGRAGCTPIDNPAPRWSHYVFLLRGLGLSIETIHEQHGGAYSGNHGRYVLHTRLQIVREDVYERKARAA
ncbi:hypothetical protein IFT84_13130 [Rhizobium sp. CFBP 8762]|uniref:winged helix domain-containing protein n=1 Tax=Rhizobium sp. CFBP 8762 TaxID=2775279 RepID=UPI00177E5E57|nr:hypothetical protein [Rhizobium sp. CFBP 8762]MBD8555448.1 hypothetical protein [Rhizobium sp. CFBP 8762]